MYLSDKRPQLLGSFSYNEDKADNAETTSLDSKPWQYPDPPYKDSLVLIPLGGVHRQLDVNYTANTHSSQLLACKPDPRIDRALLSSYTNYPWTKQVGVINPLP